MFAFERRHTRRKAAWLAVAAILLFVCGCGCGEGPFVFGILADVQYADKDTDGVRHYRTALQKLEECVADLNNQNPAFVIQLGDIVDGHENNADKSMEDLDLVLSVYNRLTMPKYHVLGNHCLVGVDKESLRQKLGLERFYYDFTVPSAKGWRFIVLDSMDGDYGIIGNEQLEWFSSTLDRAAKNGERVICFCHFNSIRLKAVDEADCVAAWFAGHHHAGGYEIRNGVHYVTIKGMVESPVRNAYALIEIHPDRLREIGVGKEPSRDLPLQTRQSELNTKGVAETSAPADADKPHR